MKINFANGAWSTQEITYANSYRTQALPTFRQYPDCVGNRKLSEEKYDYENICVMSRRQYLAGTKISTHCSFEELGAPLIVLADKMYIDETGYLRYGNYFEIVLYHNGIVVWQMRLTDGKVISHKQLKIIFSCAENEIHTLSVTVREKALDIEADEHKVYLPLPDMYYSFHAGVDACEGCCRFYDLEIEGPTCRLYSPGDIP